MTDLRTLPGIGPGLAAELRAAGIRDVEALRAAGAEEAAGRLVELGLRDRAPTQRALADALGEPAVERVAVLGVHTVVFTVGNLDAAVDHYTGFGLPVAFRSPEPALALLHIGGGVPDLLLREDTTVLDAPVTERTPRLWLEVSDARSAADTLRAAGIALLAEPFAVNGGHVVEIADRWGNIVGLADRSDTVGDPDATPPPITPTCSTR